MANEWEENFRASGGEHDANVSCATCEARGLTQAQLATALGMRLMMRLEPLDGAGVQEVPRG